MESMTGYGRATSERAGMRLQVEIRGVNNKGLDIRLFMPSSLLSHEQACRKAVTSVVSRGRVEVRVALATPGEEAVNVVVSEGVIRAVSGTTSALVDKGLLARSMTFSDLLAIPDAVRIELPERLNQDARELLLGVLGRALAAFGETRRKEGAILREQFKSSVEKLESFHREALVLAERQAPEARERLSRKIEAMGLTLDEKRLEQEVALLAERFDVTEELVRLEAHRKAIEGLLEGEREKLGKRLDHLFQEMQREVSTLLAKSGFFDLTAVGLEIRLVVEQMREQVLNVA